MSASLSPSSGLKYPGLLCHKCQSDWLMCVDPGTDPDIDPDGEIIEFGRPMRGWCHDCAPFLRGMQFDLFTALLRGEEERV